MDNLNIINLTSDIKQLENDISNWARLPFEKKLESEENCLRIYGMTNSELYDQLKRAILSNTIPKNKELIANSILESTQEIDQESLPDYDISEENKNEYIAKIETVDNLEQSPYIVIINPFFNKNIKDYTIDDLEEKYKKFCMLNRKNRRISNGYSTSIWGYNVPNMYNIMKNIINNIDNIETEQELLGESSTLSINKTNKLFSLIQEDVNRKILNDDKIGLYLTKLDSCANMDSYSKTCYNNIMPEIDKAIKCNNYSEVLPKVTPFFNPDEMKEYDINFANISNKNYYRILSDKMRSLKMDPDNEELHNDILSLGWNPSVDLNSYNINFARSRQIKWLEKYGAKVVDVTNMDIPEYVQESTISMRNLYKEKDIYPIYIVLSFTNTPFGKIIRKVKNSTYTHAGLSLDSDLQNITTFKFDNVWNGFSVESIDFYLKVTQKALLDVLVIFVDGKTKEKIESTINDFILKKDKTKYNFGNIFNVLINREKEDPENLSLICSQFVDLVLKIANIDLTNKPSNLVIPQDFYKISENPKVYKLFEGFVKDYNEKKAESQIKLLLDSSITSNIMYTEAMDYLYESIIPSSFNYITENKEANKILNEVKELLTPNKIICERKLPVRFNDKGDLSIDLKKSLEDQYQDSHKLLAGYNEDNLNGIKHELAKLFFINSTIEKKIKKMKKGDSSYKELIDLRARVLNDFKKYFKIVMEKEPDFNFTEYFQNSEYYNENIIIDNSTLKFTGSLIKKFLKSQGI